MKVKTKEVIVSSFQQHLLIREKFYEKITCEENFLLDRVLLMNNIPNSTSKGRQQPICRISNQNLGKRKLKLVDQRPIPTTMIERKKKTMQQDYTWPK